MNKNERGLTLVEILVSLVILSIIGVIIWNTFFQGYKFSQKSISKNFMLQEANILTTNLLRVHQKYTNYEIKSSGTGLNSGCEITVTPNKLTTPAADQIFRNTKLCYNYILKIDNVEKGTGPLLIEPHKKDVSLQLTIYEKNNPGNKVTIDTLLYRVKGVDYQ